MSKQEMANKIKDYRELKRMAEELAAEMETLSDEIKAAMGDSEQVIAGEYKVTWKPVTSTRLDTTALKKALPEVAERFTKTTTSRRFMVN